MIVSLSLHIAFKRSEPRYDSNDYYAMYKQVPTSNTGQRLT